ncbi:hypothetical protein GUITHDRAFT_112846 [Guillardia theta CCMP2712]|uniref:Uncharacterized protein n=1 Tax=Guillardia theta (strain CCMP2712) TaxID=905079 RepID=L1IXW5_GUITC|nr:hypothetical protein GUITHDRAFT_112846 [Guillardia theta CCMP2712]EKX41113.1 hypothetical protein GUITHDRAFT_112846 [Guillardia theta CCMP2712]|eukprot:XP_005828093.1 hypothetical protein GUITHDRAFT_112846 [Guillardia theta CCMP2712]
MHTSQSLHDLPTIQADFSALLVHDHDDESELSSQQSLASPLSPLPASRRSKELDTAESYEARRMQALERMPSRQRQLQALEHCIRLLTSPERPVITSATGQRMQL